MNKLNKKGFSAIEGLLIVVIVGLVGFVGWYVWHNHAKTTTTNSVTTPVTTSVPTKPVETTTKYEVPGLGVTLSYPKEWGDPALSDGKSATFVRGTYKQLTFSEQDKIDINFVTDAYSFYADGCGLPPLEGEQASLSEARAGTVGWSAKGVESYRTGIGITGKQVMTNDFVDENGTHYNVVKKDGMVLEYRDHATEVKAQSKDAVCGEVTQKQADEANAYHKYIHFAVNFSGSKFKGVNAQYDARKSTDSKLVLGLIAALKSLKGVK